MLYGKKFGSMSFDDAKDFCFSEDGFVALPLPNSELENDFIRSLLDNDEYAWLGITDEVWIFDICE